MKDDVKKKILEIIGLEGGAIKPAFFHEILREMVDEGTVKVVFPDNKPLDYKYEYHKVKKG